MTKTFNRRPILQNGPSKGDVKNYTFDNYKFTGFKEDKNFLEIDQYSFAECENVYVDADGLLRSRPSIKNANMFQDATRLLKQNDVYIAQYSGFYTIYYANYSQSVSGTVYTATSYGDKVYIFSEGSDGNEIVCYDKKTPSATVQTDNLIYIPETEVQANSDTTKAEPKNALTEKTKTVYFYLSSEYSQFLSNKNVIYTAFGQSFELVFDDFTKNTLLEKVVTTDANSIYAWYRNGGTLVCFDAQPNIATGFSLKGVYSYNGKTYNLLPTISGIFRGFAIASDGVHLLLAMDDNIYTCDLNNIAAGWINRSVISDRHSTYVSLSGDSDTDFHFFYRFSNSTSEANHKLCGYYNNTVFTRTISIPDYIDDGVIDIKTYPVSWTSNLSSYEYGLVLIGRTGYFPLHNNGGVSIYLASYVRSNSTIVYSIIITQISVNRFLDFNYSNGIVNVLYTGNDGTSIAFRRLNTAGSFLYTKTVSNTAFTLGNIFSDGSMARVGHKLWDLNNRFEDFTVPDSFIDVFSVQDYLYAVIQNPETLEYEVVTNNIQSPIRLESLTDGNDTIIAPEQIEQLNEYYFRVGNKLYISEYREDENGNLQWYLPEINIEEFDGFTTMCPLSSTEMGIFTETGVYVVYRSEQQYEMSTGWKYYPYIQIKSKMDVKIRKGSDVLTTYDGTSLIVPTTRGLALMSYQDFVQTTDQKLTFLSDTIYDSFEKYNIGSIKLYRYGYWFVIYKQNSNKLYLLDMRNGSWWPIDIGNRTVKQIIDYNDKPLLLLENSNVKTYNLSRSVDDYFDYDGKKINWFLRSQPLYLNAVNYYKHVQNLTFMTHILGESDDGYKVVANLTNTVYRSQVHPDAEAKTWKYDVEMIRSYVLRLNYPKVCEFEYLLESNNIDQDQPVPLSLSNITVKYRLGGQIR